MALALAASCSLLLLFLGLWEVPVSAKPKNLTEAQWFQVQHVQPRRLRCNQGMRIINSYIKRCKPRNSFIHDSFPNVARVCRSPNITCKNGQKNCHQSPNTVSITQCDLISVTQSNCRYTDTRLVKAFVVACDPPKAGDPPGYQLVPVHLDA